MMTLLEAQVRELITRLYNKREGQDPLEIALAFAHQQRREALQDVATYCGKRADMTDSREWAQICNEVTTWLTQQAEGLHHE